VIYTHTLLHNGYTHGVATISRLGVAALVGSFKLQVSFAEFSPFYRVLLQKRPIIVRSLLVVATP